MSRLTLFVLIVLSGQSYGLGVDSGIVILGGATVQGLYKPGVPNILPDPPPEPMSTSNCAPYYAEWSSYYAELAQCAEYGCESAPPSPSPVGDQCAISIPSK